jgi:hypothetical protein
MSLSLEEVVAALGDEAQVAGGAVIVIRNNKHVLVGHHTDNGFEVTYEGQEVLTNTTVTDDGVVVLAPEAAPVELKEVLDVQEDADLASALDAALAA